MRDCEIRGHFGDIKYKHKNDADHLEGYRPRNKEAGGMICLLNRKKWMMLMDEIRLSNPVERFLSEDQLPGKLVLTDLLDDDEAIVMQGDLIQIWILPQLIRYGVYDYDNPGERTRDHFYELSHSLDTLDVLSSAYFKLKT